MMCTPVSIDLRNKLIDKLLSRGGWATRMAAPLIKDEKIDRKKMLRELEWILKSSDEAVRLLLTKDEEVLTKNEGFEIMKSTKCISCGLGKMTGLVNRLFPFLFKRR